MTVSGSNNRPVRLSERAAGRANNFDVLRLAAAALVLCSHSFVLTGHSEPRIGELALGTLGVVVFFGISGFLIARSWTLRPSLRAFTIKRGLRIVPGFVLALVACAYVLGPIVTTQSPGSYLTSLEPVTYVLRNLLSVVTGGLAGGVVYDLPGVFGSNPFPDSVNGSLWTLPVEVDAYAMVAVLGLIGLLARGMMGVALAGLALLAIDGAGVTLPLLTRVMEARPESALLMTAFAVASVLWGMRDRVPLRVDLALAGIAVWALAQYTPLGDVASALVFPYAVLVAAYRSPAWLGRSVRHGDVSYGLYVLAFPVQQAIVAAWGGGDVPSAGVLTLIALPITYVLAFASWRLVESPALRLKGRLAGSGRPLPATPERGVGEGVPAATGAPPRAAVGDPSGA